MMTFTRDQIKTGRPATGRKQLAQLQAAIVGRSFWILATDRPRVASHFDELAETLNGANGAVDDAFATEIVGHFAGRDRPKAILVLVVPKRIFSATDVGDFAAWATQLHEVQHLRLLARLRAGTDLLALTSDPTPVELLLASVRDGRVSLTDPARN